MQICNHHSTNQSLEPYRPRFEVIVLLLSMLVLVSCRGDSSEPREIAGHTVSFKGIAHGINAVYPQRYCSECHGESLQGGASLEPSCLTCHGVTWFEVDGSVTRAPADHDVNNNGFFHQSELMNPEGNCDGCHGLDLQGDANAGRPGCYLCHGKLWSE